MKKAQAGFTLIELLITVVVIAILAAVFAPIYGSIASAQERASIEKHKLYNVQIGDALISYARNTSALGVLPAPYTGSGFTKTVMNPADVTPTGIALSQALAQNGVPASETNTDGTAGASVRVYQQVASLTQQVPLYFQSGPVVTLTFQYGAVYMTSCNKVTAACNPTASSGVPGDSPAMTAANYTTWTTAGRDQPAHFVSSLPVQKDMLVTTTQRLDKLRDSFLTFFRSAQITAAAGDATNFYPTSTTSLAGQTPGTNQGCRDGWYLLTTSTQLATIGLSATEFGSTAWGGAIEFCRDYDPTGTKLPDASPHYAALRIRANVSSGSAPDAAVAGNNIVLTF